MAQRAGLVLKGGVLNTTVAAARFIKDFREGALGRLTLDDHTIREGLPAIVAAQAAHSRPTAAADRVQLRVPPLDETTWNPVDAFERIRLEEKRLAERKRRRR